LYNPRAYIYSREKNLSAKMAIVIQEMIDPQISGVAFSVNPVTRDPESIVIEAILGSNELLVQGAVTPDHYMVNKNDFQITEKQICLQKEMLVLDNQFGGLKKVFISKDEQKLDDSGIKAVAHMADGVANTLNYNADIEWAFQNRELYILQSRPITAL
jgi:pyruvate,water dikinase